MGEVCPRCGGPTVCLSERLEVELADMREVVDLATKQVAERYSSYDIADGLDWREESKRVPFVELQRRRHPFEGVKP